jgi:hypothetical protein
VNKSCGYTPIKTILNDAQSAGEAGEVGEVGEVESKVRKEGG